MFLRFFLVISRTDVCSNCALESFHQMKVSELLYHSWCFFFRKQAMFAFQDHHICWRLNCLVLSSVDHVKCIWQFNPVWHFLLLFLSYINSEFCYYFVIYQYVLELLGCRMFIPTNLTLQNLCPPQSLQKK